MPELICPVNGDVSNDWTIKNAGCLDFDGVDDLVTVATAGASWATFGASDFTVECDVMKKADSSGWSNLCAFGKWNTGGSPGTNEWLLALTSTGDDQKFAFSVEVGSTTYTAVSTTTISLNTWYHVAGVRSGTSILIYVNGTLEATTTDAGITTVNTVAAIDLLIGKIAGFSSYTNMKIANIRMWSVVRTAAEILRTTQTIYGDIVNLLANYVCSQGVYGGSNPSITTMTNPIASPGRDGTLSGFALSGSTSNWVSFSTPITTAWESVSISDKDIGALEVNGSTRICLFTINTSALPTSNIRIDSVSLMVTVRRTGSDTPSLTGRLVVGGSTYTSTSVSISDNTYAYYSFRLISTVTWNRNPFLAKRWEPADMAGIQIGLSTNADGVSVTNLSAVIRYRNNNQIISQNTLGISQFTG